METLCFRRARSISGKAELTRLQRNFDSCIAELRALERSKTTRAAAAALTAGVLGTALWPAPPLRRYPRRPSSG